MADHGNSGDDVASKVIRRIEVSKMTRALQNRLALANVKIKHGWENLSIDTIEPQIDQQLKRKRPLSSADSMSESSSSVSSRFRPLNRLASSPMTAPIFSDDISQAGSNYSSYSSKRARVADFTRYPASSNQNGRKTRSAAVVHSWKKTHRLPESSPVYHTRHSRFTRPTHVSKLSFISETSTIPDEALSPEHSEDDDDDLPVLSFNMHTSFRHPTHASKLDSSPPQTPPPQRRTMDRRDNISWSRTPRTEDDGVDLLMHLANSPTPATTLGTSKARIMAPSTPPSKTTPLPSSMMSTPGGTNGLFGFGFSTPSQNFNFSDFCNVTPSPAQGSWPRTPGTAKTPSAAAREARRKLNFDSLLPPSSSPEVTRGGSSSRNTGVSLELGGALV